MKKISDLLIHWSTGPLLIGFICVFVTSFPLFHSGFFRPHDYTHAARIVEMNRSLLAGEFPVRWSEHFGFGYGMALFNFYAPLPYYVAQLPYMLSGDPIIAIKTLFILNSVLAFSGMYLFAKAYWQNHYAGIVSAILFSFATYRALDLYVRGAVGEAMAMVLLPFALYGVTQLKSRPKAGVAWTAISLAAILLSHNLSGMISLGLIVGFGLLLGHSRKYVLSLVASVAAAIGISSFYILPAFLEKNVTRIDETITVGYFDFHNHFVGLRQLIVGTWGHGGSVPGLGDGISFAVGWVLLISLVFCAVTAALSLRKNSNFKFPLSKLFILGLFFVGSLFMTTNKSVFLWEHISILKYMQFPWRFLSFAHVFAAAIAGASILALGKSSKWSVVVVLAVFVLAVGLNSSFFTPEKYIANTDEFYATNPEFIKSDLSKTLNDYLPKAIVDAHLPSPSTSRLGTNVPNTVTLTSDTPSQFDAHTICESECQISINVFQFPGWKAWIDGKSAQLQLNPDFPTYILSVPSGDHDISVQLTNTPVRTLGNVLSAVTLVLLVYIYGRKSNYRGPRR